MSRFSRRGFLKAAGAASLMSLGVPSILWAAEADQQKLRVAFIATGGRADSHLNLADSEICTAYCDVDKGRWTKIAQKAPSAKGYTDFRQMLEKHANEIDAVVVSTPDHTHAVAAMMALKMGKHVYCEKPLTWSIDEARALAAAATKYKVATQMGNQGHANEGNRLVVEWVRNEAIGDVTEVHTWTNRPVWPQGIAQRPATQRVSGSLDWDCWIGPAPYREFHDSLHPFKWRGWFDFGCGAVGDMGCHTWDCVYWSMQPDYPSCVELLRIEGKTAETYPNRAHLKWSFPAKGDRPAFEAHWYSGGWKPPVPEEILNDPVRQNEKDKNGNPKPPGLPDTGSLFIGTKGKLLVSGDYGDSPRLIPESFMRQVGKPPRLLERSPGHMNEWVMACKGEKPLDYPGSNFPGYAAPITEVMLLGAMAIKMGEVGGKIECDPVTRVILTREAAALTGREYRKGWTL